MHVAALVHGQLGTFVRVDGHVYVIDGGRSTGVAQEAGVSWDVDESADPLIFDGFCGGHKRRCPGAQTRGTSRDISQQGAHVELSGCDAGSRRRNLADQRRRSRMGENSAARHCDACDYKGKTSHCGDSHTPDCKRYSANPHPKSLVPRACTSANACARSPAQKATAAPSSSMPRSSNASLAPMCTWRPRLRVASRTGATTAR